jgi:hypothetical protein
MFTLKIFFFNKIKYKKINAEAKNILYQTIEKESIEIKRPRIEVNPQIKITK